MAANPELRKGPAGWEGAEEWVKYLEQALASGGYGGTSAGGVFDDDLENEVMRFQAANGLAADGVVGPSTWEALAGAAPAAAENAGQEATLDADSAQFLDEMLAASSFEEFFDIADIEEDDADEN